MTKKADAKAPAKKEEKSGLFGKRKDAEKKETKKENKKKKTKDKNKKDTGIRDLTDFLHIRNTLQEILPSGKDVIGMSENNGVNIVKVKSRKQSV